ncbi:MAG: ribosome maturation factor RimP, partial [Bacillota bacterium]
ILEVSSPGLERPLKDKEDYQRFTGELVRIKTYAPIEGQKEFVGTLLKFEENKVSLELKDDGGVMEIPFSKIAHGNLTIDF